MKIWLTGLGIAVGAAPLLLKVPYVIQAWRRSNLDRGDWVFVVVFALLIAVAWRTAKPGTEAGKGWFAGVLLLGAAVCGAGMAREIHALSVVGGVIWAWGCWGVFRGWRSAYRVLPAFGVLLLACPSSSYWLDYLLGVDGFGVKIALGVVLTTWQAVHCSGRELPVRVALFGAAVSGVIGLYWAPVEYSRAFPAYQPGLSDLRCGEFIGRVREPSEEDRRFFGESKVERRFFAGDHRRVVHTLTVSDFERVHQVHPAGHCLRTSGHVVSAEALRTVELNGHVLQVCEVVAQKQNSTTLVWSWYSSPTVSSGSFLFFRHHYQAAEDWRSYQISTPIIQERREAEQTLKNFLQAVDGAEEVLPTAEPVQNQDGSS